MSHVDPRPTRPGAWAAALSLLLFLAVPVFAQDQIQPVRVIPASPCTFDDVRMIFTICTCNSRILSAARVSDVDARVDVATNPTIVCVQCRPDTVGVDFGRLPAGHHRLGGMIVHHIVAGPDSGQVRTENYVVEFDVRNDCGPDPVPLPWLTGVQADSACAGDSIQVQLKGVFNDPCYAVIELSAHPNPSASPLPQPDVVRIVYEHDPCTPCPAILTPWSGQLPIGPLPLGDYRLPVEAYLRERCPGGTGDSLLFLGRTSFPFRVSPCEPTGPCYLASFVRPIDLMCTDVIGPDNPGEATFQLVTAVAPAGGVQGKLVFDRPGLRIIAIEPVHAGTLLKWDPAEKGASFVAVLPPTVAVGAQPIFRVRVALLPGATLTGFIRLMPEQLLVSDTHGVAMPMCDISRLRLIDPSAIFCPEAACDMNADAHSDVRDLVLMVNCLASERACPWAGMPDCDGNGQRDIDDVLCCARVVLGGSPPDSVGSVPAPEIAVEFGAPIAVTGGLDVPVRVTSRSQVGAARLQFTYPDAGFSDATIALVGAAPNWLALSEGSGGTLRLGVLRIGPELTDQADAPLDFKLHLVRREGVSPSGALSFVSGDFSSTEGLTLVTSAGPLSMPLAPGAALAVGLARPNPFGRETRFSVSLTHDAVLDVAIYDLAGRKVATLWNGPALAGTKDLVWRRTRDDGTIVPSGMYFYRATSEGHSHGGKVLVLTRD